MCTKVRPSDFQVVMVELDGHSPAKDQRVWNMTLAGGLRPAPPAVRVQRSEIFLSPRLIEALEPIVGSLEEYGSRIEDGGEDFSSQPNHVLCTQAGGWLDFSPSGQPRSLSRRFRIARR